MYGPAVVEAVPERTHGHGFQSTAARTERAAQLASTTAIELSVAVLEGYGADRLQMTMRKSRERLVRAERILKRRGGAANV